MRHVLIGTHVIFLLCFKPPCAQTGRRDREDISVWFCKVCHSNYPSLGLWMSDAFIGHTAKASSQEVPSQLAVLMLFFCHILQLSIMCYSILVLLAQNHNSTQQVYSLNIFYLYLDPFIHGDSLQYGFTIYQVCWD